jgi:hypothetical protein
MRFEQARDRVEFSLASRATTRDVLTQIMHLTGRVARPYETITRGAS